MYLLGAYVSNSRIHSIIRKMYKNIPIISFKMTHEDHWTTIQLPRSHFPETMVSLAILNYFKKFNLFGTSWNILYRSQATYTSNCKQIIHKNLTL